MRRLRPFGWGGCLVFSLRVLLLPSWPVISLFDGWGLQSILRCVQLNGVIHRVVRPLWAAATFFYFCFRALSNAAHASGSQSLQTWHGDSLSTQRKSFVEATLLAATMVVTTTSKVWATRELELPFLRRQLVLWFRYLALLTGSEWLFTQVGIKDVLCQMWHGKTATPGTDWRVR